MPTPISATIVTKNEAEKLPACLLSLGWVDQVVIVDCGSTDDTIAIAKASGAVVHQKPWRGYVGQKNLAAELAEHDWIFNIDADERVGRDLQEAIRLANFGASAYSIVRLNDFLGRPHRAVHRARRDAPIRLYDRRCGGFGGEHVHERVIVEGIVGHLRGTLFHEGFRGIEDMADRLNRYSTLLAAERPGRPSMLRIALRPLVRLSWALFRQGLIRDGRRGVILAGLWAHHDLLVEAKRYEDSLEAGTPFDPRDFADGCESD